MIKIPNECAWNQQFFGSQVQQDIFAGNNFTGVHYLNADKKMMRLLAESRSPGLFQPFVDES